MAGDKHSEKSEATPSEQGSGIKVAIGALILLLGGLGAGAGGMMLSMGMPSSGSSEHAGSGGEHGEAASGHGEAAPEHGEAASGHGEAASGGHGEAAAGGPPVHGGRTVVNLGLFTVNLRGSGGGRVLRTEVQVEVSAKEYTLVETRKPLLRDAVITLASDFSYGELEGVDGKTHLRDELQGRLNNVLSGSPKVERVYFTEFVVQ